MSHPARATVRGAGASAELDAGVAARRPFLYAEHAPPASVAELVVSLWSFEVRADGGAPPVHHVWPDGCVSLCVDVRRDGGPVALLMGPTVEAQRVPVVDGQLVCGVRFWPDAAGVALGVAPTALRERVVPAAGILGPAALTLAELVAGAPRGDEPAALARWLEPRLAGAAPLDDRVREAVRLTARARGELPVGRVAAAVALSPRQLQRRFGAAVGLTPKEYARIRRMRSVLGELLRGAAGQAALAGALGFADQAHLSRELRELTGLTPGALRERLGAIDHLDVTP